MSLHVSCRPQRNKQVTCRMFCTVKFESQSFQCVDPDPNSRSTICTKSSPALDQVLRLPFKVECKKDTDEGMLSDPIISLRLKVFNFNDLSDDRQVVFSKRLIPNCYIGKPCLKVFAMNVSLLSHEYFTGGRLYLEAALRPLIVDGFTATTARVSVDFDGGHSSATITHDMPYLISGGFIVMILLLLSSFRQMFCKYKLK